MGMSVGRAPAPVDMLALMGKYARVDHELLNEDANPCFAALKRGRMLSESLHVAVERASALFERIEAQQEAPSKGPFFLSKAAKVWEAIENDPDCKEVLTDINALVEATNNKSYRLSFEQRETLAVAHEQVIAGKVYQYWMSKELFEHIEEIARASQKEGSQQDSKLAKDVCVLLANWNKYLSYFTDRSRGEEFLANFGYATSSLSVNGMRFVDRLYYHVWDLAKKDGIHTEGARWGQEHALDNIPRLQEAVKELRREVLEGTVTQPLDRMAANPVDNAKHLAQALAAWPTYVEAYPTNDDNKLILDGIREKGSSVILNDKTSYERLCFLIWDLARKEGIHTEGENWGEIHLFDDSKRLCIAIGLLRDELISLEMAPTFGRINEGVNKGDVDAASHAAELTGIIQRLQELMRENPELQPFLVQQLREVAARLQHGGKPLLDVVEEFVPLEYEGEAGAAGVLSPSSKLTGLLNVVEGMRKPRTPSESEDPTTMTPAV